MKHSASEDSSPRRLPYTDRFITEYSRYVNRTAASATPGAPQTLRFHEWFYVAFQALPGDYLDAAGITQEATTDSTPPPDEATL